MMKYILPALILIAIFILFSCKTRKYQPGSYEKKQLFFGSGGGFTGKVQEYKLLENGQFFYINELQQDTIELKGMKKKEAKVFFEKVEGLEDRLKGFRQPDNLYYYIGIVEAQEEKFRSVWGSSQIEPPDKLVGLYRELAIMGQDQYKEYVEKNKEKEEEENTEPPTIPEESDK